MPDALEVAAEQDRQFAKTGKLLVRCRAWSWRSRISTTRSTSHHRGRRCVLCERPPAEDSTSCSACVQPAPSSWRNRISASTLACRAVRSRHVLQRLRYRAQPAWLQLGFGSSSRESRHLCDCGGTGSSVRVPRARRARSHRCTRDWSAERHDSDRHQTRESGRSVVPSRMPHAFSMYRWFTIPRRVTAFSIAACRSKPYESSTRRPASPHPVGVVREYMNKTLSPRRRTDHRHRRKAVNDLRALGQTIVDPGPEGDLLTVALPNTVRRTAQGLHQALPRSVPIDKNAKPTSDHVSALLDLKFDRRSHEEFTLRDFAGRHRTAKYMLKCICRAGDANIKSNADLIASRTSITIHISGSEERSRDVEGRQEFDLPSAC